jgi:hypothetical protein
VKARSKSFEERATNYLSVVKRHGTTGGRMKRKKQSPLVADGDIVVERTKILDREYLILAVPIRKGYEEVDEDLLTEAEDEVCH